MQGKSSIASTAQHVTEETWPENARPATDREVITEPKAEEKANASAGPENFKFQIFLVKSLPILRNPKKIKKNLRTSICGFGIKDLVSYLNRQGVVFLSDASRFSSLGK
jgi:hypothetical protein